MLSYTWGLLMTCYALQLCFRICLPSRQMSMPVMCHISLSLQIPIGCIGRRWRRNTEGWDHWGFQLYHLRPEAHFVGPVPSWNWLSLLGFLLIGELVVGVEDSREQVEEVVRILGSRLRMSCRIYSLWSLMVVEFCKK